MSFYDRPAEDSKIFFEQERPPEIFDMRGKRRIVKAETNEIPQYYSTQESASLLDLHVETVQELINKGYLKTVMSGGRFRVSSSSLKEFLEQSQND